MEASSSSSLAPPKNGVRHFVWVWSVRLARDAALCYLGVMLVFYVIQNRFVFPGSSTTQGQHDAIIFPSVEYELLSLPLPDGRKIAAVYGTALDEQGHKLADPHSRPTVVYFYGNGSCMAYSMDVFRDLRYVGVNVIVPEYEGYGMNAGNPSESGCYATADAAYDFLLTRKEVDSRKIVAMGWSMGAAVAIDLASRRPTAGLITVSAFTTLSGVAHEFFPWLPMSLILRYRFDNIEKIAQISCPIMLVHGRSDELVPFWMEAQLAKAAKGKVTIFNVAGGGHNDVFDKGGGYLYEQFGAFLDQLTPKTAATHGD
jgi:uncharacterized protein